MTPLVWIKESEIATLEGVVFWDTTMSSEPKEGYVPLHAYTELNIDYKKEWVLAQEQSKVYEKLWIQYRDIAVKLDKELNELRKAQAEIEALKAKLNKYHLKEDLDRNLNLIYGKEFIK